MSKVIAFYRQEPSPPSPSAMVADRLHRIGYDVALPHGLVLRVVQKTLGDTLGDWSSWFISVGDPNGKCNETGKPMPWWGRKFYISPHMTDGEIVQTIFLACKIAMEHELREQFKYKGVSVFDPHYDIEELVGLHRSGKAKEEREHG